MPSALLDSNQTRVHWADKKVDSLCPFCGVGCQVTYQVKDDRVIYAEAALWGATPTLIEPAGAAAREIAAIAVEIDSLTGLQAAA